MNSQLMPCPTCYAKPGELCIDSTERAHTSLIHNKRDVLYNSVILSRAYMAAGAEQRQALFKEMLERYVKTLFPSGSRKRGDGETARGMLRCPRGAVFVWCNGNLIYPNRVKDYLMREDLTIVTPSWVEEGRWYGIRKAVRFDHAFGTPDALNLRERCWAQYRDLKGYLKIHNLDG